MLPDFGLQESAESELFGEPERLELLRQAAHILVVDDESANVRLLSSLLERAGFQSVSGLTDPARIERSVRESPPDLVILDLHLPGRDGIDVLKALAPLIAGERLPVLVITGDGSADARQQALMYGAKDFVTKPFDLLEVTLRVRNLIETRLLFQDLRKHNRALLESSRGRRRELESTRVEMVERLAMAAEYRDDSTNRHNERVGEKVPTNASSSNTFRVEIVSKPPRGMASRALTARLSSTCSNCAGSTRTVSRSCCGHIARSMSSPIKRRSRPAAFVVRPSR